MAAEAAGRLPAIATQALHYLVLAFISVGAVAVAAVAAATGAPGAAYSSLLTLFRDRIIRIQELGPLGEPVAKLKSGDHRFSDR